jgi:condensin complex subunit 2
MPNLAELDSKTISQSLSEFSFDPSAIGNDIPLYDSAQASYDDDDEENAGEFNAGGADGGEAQDFFDNDDGGVDDFVGGDMGGGDSYGDHYSNGSAGPSEGGPSEVTGPMVPFDPRQSNGERELTMGPMDESGGGLMDYFDKNLTNWAGPNHWKVRRPTRRGKSIGTFHKIVFKLHYSGGGRGSGKNHEASSEKGSL